MKAIFNIKLNFNFNIVKTIKQFVHLKRSISFLIIINKKIEGSIKQIGTFKTDVIIMKIFAGTGSMDSPQCLIDAS